MLKKTLRPVGGEPSGKNTII